MLAEVTVLMYTLAIYAGACQGTLIKRWSGSVCLVVRHVGPMVAYTSTMPISRGTVPRQDAFIATSCSWPGAVGGCCRFYTAVLLYFMPCLPRNYYGEPTYTGANRSRTPRRLISRDHYLLAANDLFMPVLVEVGHHTGAC